MSDQQDRAAPRTEAGRLFAREFREWLVYEGWEREGWDLDATAREFTKSILAVEREAVTPLPQIDAQRLARAFQIVQSRTTDEHPDWSIADVALEYQRLGVTSETTGGRAMTSEDRAAPWTEAGRLLPVFAEIGDVPFRAPDGTMWENLTDAVLSVEREAGVHEHGQLSYEAAARIVGRLSPPPVAAGAEDRDRLETAAPVWNEEYVRGLEDAREALAWAMAPNPRHEGRHRTEPRCSVFMPTDANCDCGYEAAHRALLATPVEAAAPGAAALDRIAELEAVLRRAARDLHNIAYGLHDPTDFEHCRNVRCIDFLRLLGARAAEPKPPESGE